MIIGSSDNGRYQKIVKELVRLGEFNEACGNWRYAYLITPIRLLYSSWYRNCSFYSGLCSNNTRFKSVKSVGVNARS